MSRRRTPAARVAGRVALAALLVSLALAGSAVADGSNLAHPRPDDDTTTTTDVDSGSQTEAPTRVVADDDSDVLLVGGGFLTGGLLVALGVAIGRWTQ